METLYLLYIASTFNGLQSASMVVNAIVGNYIKQKVALHLSAAQGLHVSKTSHHETVTRENSTNHRRF